MNLNLDDIDDHLKSFKDFEELILAPLRVTKNISVNDIAKCLGWAISLERINQEIDPSGDKLINRLFIALLDNPRLSEASIHKFIPLFKETDEEKIKMEFCLKSREELKDSLFDLSVVLKSKNIKELIRSNRGDFKECFNKKDVMIELFKDLLESNNVTFNEKVNTLTKMLKKKELNDTSSQRQLLHLVKIHDPTILEKIYESIT